MSEHDEHSSFIKTPQQLVVVVLLSLPAVCELDGPTMMGPMMSNMDKPRVFSIKRLKVK